LYPEAEERLPEAMFLYPKAEELFPEAVLQYPTAVERSPCERFWIPTAVESFPMVEVATTVPVIAPVVVFRVAPLALFNIPNPTEANPPVPEKFCRPNIWELSAEAVFLYPEAEE
jgi:hypothetical protein